ncbi:MAG: hypothetical protein LBC60_08685, partial [Spirochaetaceae bacterium]|nr:hypothetical protein [Spirochaetaceae bacterium]
FPGLIMAVQEEAGLDWFSPQAVEDSLIIHEFFHHDETRRNAPVDKMLAKKFGVPVPPVYRDIAAFACTNRFLKGPPCQLMDILWLYRRHPASCAAALKRCEPGLFHNSSR